MVINAGMLNHLTTRGAQRERGDKPSCHCEVIITAHWGSLWAGYDWSTATCIRGGLARNSCSLLLSSLSPAGCWPMLHSWSQHVTSSSRTPELDPWMLPRPGTSWQLHKSHHTNYSPLQITRAFIYPRRRRNFSVRHENVSQVSHNV